MSQRIKRTGSSIDTRHKKKKDRSLKSGYQLYDAVSRGYVYEVRNILQSHHRLGATFPIKVQDGDVGTPVHLLQIAARYGRVEMTRLLLQFQLYRDTAKEKDFRHYLPLHEAAASGRTKIARMLLEVYREGAAVTGSLGFTPFHCATYHCNYDCLALLMGTYREGAKVKDCEGRLPLHWACEIGDVACVAVLLEDVGKDELTTADYENGNTVFHYAVASANVECLKLLLEVYPDGAKVVNKKGMLPLHLATGDIPSGGHCHVPVEFVSVLLDAYEYGAHVRDSAGNSPMEFALLEHRDDMVKLLLERTDYQTLFEGSKFSTW